MIRKLILLLLTVGCASNSVKDQNIKDLDNVTNKDFVKETISRYQSSDDSFKVKPGKKFVLSDEAILDNNQIEDEIDGDKPKINPIDQILVNCLNKNYKKAFEIVEINTDKYKTHPSYWNQVGTCFLLKKEYRKAILYFNKSLEFKPNYSPALNNIGVMYRRMGDDQKAEVAFDSATKSSPYAKTPRFNLAQIYLEYGLSGNARTHLNVLVKAGGDSTVYNSMAVSYLMEDNLVSAGSYFSKIKIDDFEKPEFGINYVSYLIRIKKLEKAKDILGDIEIDKKSKYFRTYSKLLKEVRK